MQTVRRELYAVRKTIREIVHELISGLGIAAADCPREYQLGIRVQADPRPDIAVSQLAFLFCGHVLTARIAKRPNFIGLDSLRRDVRTCSSWKFAQAVPRSTNSFVTVLMLTPTIRVTLRRLFPSTSAATIRARSAVLSLFILNIVRESPDDVKC